MKGKLLLSLLLVSGLTLGSFNSTYAEDFNTILKTNVDNVKKGDIVPVTLELDLTNSMDEVHVYKGTLEYDKNIFEEVTQEDFCGINSWQDVFYNPRTQEFIVTSYNGTIENEDFLKVNLKAKKTTSLGKSAVKVSNCVVSEGSKDIEKPVSTNLVVEVNKDETTSNTLDTNVPSNNQETVIGSTNQAGNVSTNEGNNAQNLNSQTTNNEIVSSENLDNEVEDNKEIVSNDSNNSLDDTHKVEDLKNDVASIYNDDEVSNSSLYFLVATLVISILLTVFILWKMRKNKGFLSVFLALGIISSQGFIIASAISKKGELTGNDLIDFEDARLLQKYLIDISDIDDDKLQNADLNYDGSITVSDLALLIKKVNKKLEYKVDIKTVSLNRYPKKNEKISYEFKSDVSYGALIDTITINKKEYKVDYDKNNNTYTVKIDGYDSYGLKSINISKVKLNNKEEVKLDFSEKVEVLKDLPAISDYLVTDDINESKVGIDFTVTDKDEAIISGEAIIKDSENNVVSKNKITKGKNYLEAKLVEGKLYNVELKVLYDLDSNSLSQNDNKNYLVLNKELVLNPDYNFVFDNLKSYDINGNENSLFDKQDDVYLGFNSSNNSKFIPEYLVVNETEYKVVLENDKYKVNIGKLNNSGKNTLNVTKVILNNGKYFDLDENIEVIVNKDLPTVENLNITQKDDKLSISFETKDLDNALDKIKIVGKNSNKEILFEKEIDKDKAVNEEFEIDNMLDVCIVEVVADYTLSDNVSEKNKVLVSKESKLEPKVEIISSKINKDKFEKGETAEVVYTIKTNKKEEIKKLQVNNAIQNVYSLGNDKYQITVSLDDKAGLKEIILQKVIFSDETEFEVSHEDSVEVLKQAPKVENFILEEGNSKVDFKFNINDLDKSFKSGKIVLTSKDGDKQEKDFNKTDNLEFSFDVKDGMTYTVEVFLTYARDEESTDIVENEKSFDNTFTFNLDYKFTFDDLKTVNSNKQEQTYFNRDENVYLRFYSSNASNSEPKYLVVNNKTYNVSKDENGYFVDLGIITNLGKNDLDVTSVILDNGKEFNITQKASVVIRKFEPKISNLESSMINGDLDLSFDISDSDKALDNIKIVIKDTSSNTIYSETVTASTASINRNIKVDNNLDKYVIEVLGSYTLSDNDKVNDEVLVSKEFKNENRVLVTNQEVNSKYLEKGSNLEITYIIDSNRNEAISSMLINGIEYSVENLGNEKYKVVIPVGVDAGVKEYTLTKVIFSDNVGINVSNQVSVEVLKSIPVVDNLSFTNMVDGKISVNFNVEDLDNSFKSGTVILTDENKMKTRKEFTDLNDLSFEFTVQEGSYNVEVLLDYQRDEKGSISEDNKSMLNEVINIVNSEKFDVTHIETTDSNGNDKKDFTKTENVYLSITADVSSGIRPKDIFVNGTKYTVNGDNGNYIVDLGTINTSGKNELNIEKVVLNNLKEVSLNKTLSVNIAKEPPIIENMTVSESSNKLNVGFNVVDIDNTIESMKLVVKDGLDKIIFEEKVDGENVNKEIEITDITDKYTVEVYSTYRLSSNEVLQDEKLISREVIALDKVVVTNSKANNATFEKNTNAKITYTVDTNKKSNVSKLVVDGVEYQATRLKNNEYEVSVPVLDKAGKKVFELSKVIFDDGKTFDVTNSLEVEVLKDKVSLNNFRYQENVTEEKLNVSFDILDKDNALKSGKVVLSTSNDTVEKTFKPSDNLSFDFDVKEGKYKLEVFADYQRDIEGNIVESKCLLNQNIDVVFDYEYTLTDLNVSDVNGVNKTYFNKDEDVVLSFNSTNNTKYDLDSIVVNGNTHKVIKNTTGYTVNLGKFNKAGLNKINVTSLVLSNSKAFEVDETINITVNKTIPQVKGLDITELDNKLNVTFSIEDIDNAVIQATLVVKNGSGNEILNEVVTGSTISKDIPINDITNKYVAEVHLSYNLSDKDSNTEVYTDEVIAKDKVLVKNVSLNNNYLEKNSYIEATYTIETNRVDNPTKAYINGKEYPFVEIGTNQYKATIPVGDTAKKDTLNLTSIIFNTDSFAVNSSANYEVLKDVPTVKDVFYTEDLKTKKANFSFRIEDIDSAFKSGKVVLTATDGTVTERTINGLNNLSFEFDVKEQEYKFEVYLDYARDIDGVKEFTNQLAHKETMTLLSNYNFSMTNLKTVDEANTTSKTYFTKTENVGLEFEATNNSNNIPSKVTINNQEYDVKTHNDKYYVNIGTYNTGVQTITIDKVILDNNKELNITTNNTVSFEVLKDKPTVSNVTVKNKGIDEVVLNINVEDDGNALRNASITINDGSKDIVTSQTINSGVNEITFKLGYGENYNIKINGDYDLDSDINNNLNNISNTEIYSDNIVIKQELLELKDIESMVIYRSNNGVVEAVSNIDVDNFNPSEHIVKVNMKDLPDTYFEIEKAEVVGNDLMLTLKQDNVVQYDNSGRSNKLVVRYGEVSGNQANNSTIESLINQMKSNPTGTYELTCDLDASKYNVDTLFDFEFRGTLNGNGYTIKNLKGTLFNTLNNATIENLFIENANVTRTRGIIANTATDTTLTNVHIKDSSVDVKDIKYIGGLIGETTRVTIEKCSATNIKVNSNTTGVGGLIGKSLDHSIIRDSYITGVISGPNNCIGGMVGEVLVYEEMTISDCYAKVELKANDKTAGIGGIIGSAIKASIEIQDTISLADGNYGNRVIGFGYESYYINAINVYELSESKLKTNIDISGIKEKLKNYINEGFFISTLSWNEKVWNMSNASIDNLPTLITNKKVTTITTESTIVDRIKSLPDYDSSRNIAYKNMYKLSPFIDAKYLVRDGNKVDIDSLLNTQEIQKIYAYDENNKVLIGVNTDNYDDIKKIKIVYKNNKLEEYNVTFEKLIGNITKYTIDNLGINYTYNKYVLDLNSSIVNKIVEDAKKLTYDEIETVTKEKESRLYKDYYTESVLPRMKEVITSIISSRDDFNIYIDNNVLNDIIKSYFYDSSGNFDKKILYTYTYFDKWYNFDIGGLRISDEILFNGDYLFEDWVNDTVNKASKDDRLTKETIRFYEKIIKPRCKEGLSSLLEGYITTIGGETNAKDWFTHNFKGMLYEQPIVGKEEQVVYRAWDMLKKRNNMLLPILSAPQQDMYLISVPSQMIIGSANKYPQYISNGREGMLKIMENHAKLVGNFYGTSSEFIDDATSRLNSKVHVQYDTRFDFPSNSKYPGTQDKGSTQDPVIKWVYEAIDSMAPGNGSSAFANGTDVYWVVSSAIGSDWAYRVFTHETAHNQDGYYFYEGNNRRGLSEENADGTITQMLDPRNGMVFNLTKDYSYSDDVSVNFTLDRIKGKDKIHSYYKGMFDTFYLLDYLNGLAFLQLTPEEQSKLAVQVSYKDVDDSSIEDSPEGSENTTPPTLGGTSNDTGGEITVYKKLTADEFRSMKLDSIEDLWDNRIALLPKAGEVGINQYGAGTHYDVHWYQPHNDNGRPDSRSLQRIGFEMLAYAGYTDGFVEYRSNKSKSDLGALRKITSSSTMTFKQFRMDRYKEVEDNLSTIPYFSKDEVIQMYLEAMKQDAKNGNRTQTDTVRRVLYGTVKRATRDFSSGTIYDSKNKIDITSATQLIEEIKKNPGGTFNITQDLDFTGIQNEEGYYINDEFFGVIEGNNHKFNNVNATLFKKISYSNIKNIVVQSPDYLPNVQYGLAKGIKNSVISNFKILESANGILMNDRLSQEGYVRQKDLNITLGKIKIRTAQDLLNIGQSPTSLQMKYQLVNDIDLSTISTTGATYIQGPFMGLLDGNGYSITNGNKPIFEDVVVGTIQNLNIKDFTIDNSQGVRVGALASQIGQMANIQKINLNNINITANGEVGSLVGYAGMTSSIEQVNATNVNINTTGSYAGGLVGKAMYSYVGDVSVQGTVTVGNDYGGGIVGSINGTTVKNALSNVSVNKESSSQGTHIGGLIGYIEGDATTSIVKYCMSVGDVGNGIYKSIPSANTTDINIIKSSFTKVYERSSATGITGVKNETTGKIFNATDENLRQKTFYTNTLRWNEVIWDFADIANGGYPKIKTNN